jgi:hypothetical protein
MDYLLDQDDLTSSFVDASSLEDLCLSHVLYTYC